MSKGKGKGQQAAPASPAPAPRPRRETTEAPREGGRYVGGRRVEDDDGARDLSDIERVDQRGGA